MGEVMFLDFAEDEALVTTHADGRRTMETPPILVEEDAHCEECGQVHDMEKCPDYGAWIDIGYGLAFGGCGTYKSCVNSCGWSWKELDEEEG